MRCPFCDFEDSKVVDSRNVDNFIRRRRQCLRCSLRYTTQERIQGAVLALIKRDGRREQFNRSKLASGLRKACAKRPLPIGSIEKLVDDIEGELQKLGKAEVPSGIIGEMVMSRLRKLDRVAYIRFASVYRDFEDVETFKEEVDSLLEAGKAVESPSAQMPMFMEEEKTVPRRRRGRGKPGIE
ncbi:MAG: transcriptional repressor NrdR [Chloroflexi bacterium]|nr:transcriptional repressor NrdR [Chloroflexota bacterium]